jgi:hypothetical protein
MSEFYTYVYFTLENSSLATYVGKGSKTRYRDHLKARSAFGEHIRTQQAKGIYPICVKVYHPSEQAALDEERRLVSLYGRLDLGTGTLYNRTKGGQGWSESKSVQGAASIAAATRLLWTNKEYRQKMAACHHQPASEDKKAKLRVANTLAWADPEIRARHLAAINSAAVRAKKSEGMKRVWAIRKAAKAD